VPVKERDLTIVSSTLQEGALFISRLLRTLIEYGTCNFSLVAMPNPAYVIGKAADDDFRSWPTVVWRLVDRGDPAVSRSDIGCMELFGSPVVATDPFQVAGWLHD